MNYELIDPSTSICRSIINEQIVPTTSAHTSACWLLLMNQVIQLLRCVEVLSDEMHRLCQHLISNWGIINELIDPSTFDVEVLLMHQVIQAQDWFNRSCSVPLQQIGLFTDECDKFKDLTHVHSFVHDFHLRTVQTFISGSDVFCPGYHLAAFFQDFISHFPNEPSFSRNYIHEGDALQVIQHNIRAFILNKYHRLETYIWWFNVYFLTFRIGMLLRTQVLCRCRLEAVPASSCSSTCCAMRISTGWKQCTWRHVKSMTWNTSVKSFYFFY